MHWVVQKSLFKPGNYELLVSTLRRFNIDFTPVKIHPKTNELSPDLSPPGKVYVCGAIRLKAIAEKRGWSPGSFLNENFRFDLWQEKLGNELLNAGAITGSLKSIQSPSNGPFFIRPLEDNKAFDGVVIDRETLDDWRSDTRKASLMGLQVVVSELREIFREYRVFVVNKQVVTGSMYKIGGRAEVSPHVEQKVFDYVESIVKKWVPAESFVIDISLGPEGFKIIEFNNINSSGFYAINMNKYVQAIQQNYAK